MAFRGVISSSELYGEVWFWIFRVIRQLSLYLHVAFLWIIIDISPILDITGKVTDVWLGFREPRRNSTTGTI